MGANMKKNLEFYKDKNEILSDAFERTVAAIHLKKLQKEHKTFLLCGSEPRVGTTMLAVNLAISTAIAGWKTMLLDCDLRKEKGYKRVDDNVENGITDYVALGESLASITYDTNYENLSYISCGSFVQNPISILCSGKMDELIQALRAEYDFIFIDCPSMSTAIDGQVLGAKLDAVILVAAQLESSEIMLRQAKYDLEKVGASIEGVIYNKVNLETYKKHMKYFDYFREGKYKNKIINASVKKERD